MQLCAGGGKSNAQLGSTSSLLAIFASFFTFISSSLSTTNNLTLCFESSTIFLACQRATIDRNVEKRRNEMSHFCGFFQQVIILSVAADDSTHRLRNSNYVIHLLLLQARAFDLNQFSIWPHSYTTKAASAVVELHRSSFSATFCISLSSNKNIWILWRVKFIGRGIFLFRLITMSTLAEMKQMKTAEKSQSPI